MSRPRAPGPLAVSLLFVASGATALVYEVVWFKRLAQVLGSSSLAHAAVVAGFLAGLGLGAWLLGRVADRLASPLRGYAWCEAGIGVLALLVPLALTRLDALAPLLAEAGAQRPLVALSVRMAAVLVVLGPPCALMGATLPLLTRHLARTGRPLGASIAWLYALNALGAAVGALGAGFLLLPAVGLARANTLAALASLAVAAAAFLLARRREPAERVDLAEREEPAERVQRAERTEQMAEPSERAERAGALPLAAAPGGRASVRRDAERAGAVPGAGEPRRAQVAVAAALAGAAALGLQILWTRQLGLVLGGTTYAFTAVLAVFIAGLGAGSLLYRALERRVAPRPLLAAAALGIVVTGLAGRALLPALTVAVGALLPVRVDPLANLAVATVAALAVQGLPTVGMGLLFPALVAATGAGGARAGRAVGEVYGWNTVGSIAGATGGALGLLPALGTHAGVELLLAVYALVLLVLFPPVLWRTSRVTLPAAGLALLFALGVPWPPEDPRVTNFGMYVYGPRRPAELAEEFRVLSFAEGRTCNVLVLEHPRLRNLRVNGKVDASDAPEDMVTQLGLAVLPRLVRPVARDVLVVGFGSGVTSGASLLFPGTRVTCCEIEPEVLAASPFFHHVNRRPETSRAFTAVVDDGRSHLQGTSARYDLVLSAPSNPWIAGVANLFTVEFYAAARARLSPGGLLAQWMQTYAVEERELAAVVRSVRAVFPHVGLARTGAGDTILLASDAPIVPGPEALDTAQEAIDLVAPLQDDLARTFGTTDARALLLAHLVWEEPACERFLAGRPDAPLHTDLDLALEFEAPRQLFAAGLPGAELRRTAVQRALLGAAAPEAFAERLDRLGAGPAQVPALLELRETYARAGLVAHVAALTALARGARPADPALVADTWLVPGAPIARARPRFDADVARLVAEAPAEALRLGTELAARDAREPARSVLEALAAAQPASATVWAELARQAAALGHEARAREALARALELDPLHARARAVEALLAGPE